MKRLAFLASAIFLSLPLFASAQVGIQQLNQWKTGGLNYLQPIKNTYGLLVPGLATTTTGCLSVASNGWIGASGSACGSGGGSLTGTTGQLPYFSGTNTAVGTSSLFLSTGGLLGVGTTSPFANLSVHASYGATNTTLLAVASSTATATSTLFSIANTGGVGVGGAPVAIGSGLFTVYGKIVAGNGNVSINDSNDAAYFERAGYNQFHLYNTAVNGYISENAAGTLDYGQPGDDTTAGLQLWTANGTRVSIGTTGQDRLTVLGTGNVGIGTTSPFALTSLMARNGATNTSLFAIGSSTATATTTLFAVDNTGKFTAGDPANGSIFFGNGAGTAMLATSTTVGDTVFGYQALGSATSSSNSTAIGYRALVSAQDYTANNNTALGSNALSNLTTGFKDVGIGNGAGQSITTGAFNIAVGSNAMAAGAVTGSTNVAVGSNSQSSLTSGNNNAAIGNLSLRNNTIGSDNVAIGSVALAGNGLTGSSQNQNVGIGSSAFINNTTPINSVGVGYGVGQGNTGNYTNNNSTLLGWEAGFNFATSSNNDTLLGRFSGGLITTGSENTEIGSTPNTTGTAYLTTGGGNIGIGFNHLFPSATASNQLNIGNLIFGTLPATTSATAFSLPTAGTVGIGTSSPFAKLSVHANNGDTTSTLLAVASSTATATTTLLSTTNGGQTTACEAVIATTSSMTINFQNTCNQVDIQMGFAAATITLTGAKAGDTKRIIVSNPGGTAGAITWSGISWFGGTAPTQTTTGNSGDMYSCITTQGSSTVASSVKIECGATAGLQ